MVDVMVLPCELGVEERARMDSMEGNCAGCCSNASTNSRLVFKRGDRTDPARVLQRGTGLLNTGETAFRKLLDGGVAGVLEKGGRIREDQAGSTIERSRVAYDNVYIHTQRACACVDIL